MRIVYLDSGISTNMTRTINGQLVKRLRNDKGWSQEELAIAADLSARTVQRLEAEGSGSLNSVKSIAAALEIDMHNLNETPQPTHGGVRWGYAGVVVGSIGAAIGIVSGWVSGGSSAATVGFSLGVLGLLAGCSCALIGWGSRRQIRLPNRSA